MPTQSTTYNTRLTDEALEKRFRDTFRSQGGAELVDDLYASGVIVPVVDFTSAAEGSALRQDLQTAWDFATTRQIVSGATVALVSTAGFYKVGWNAEVRPGGGAADVARLQINDGATTTIIVEIHAETSTSTYQSLYYGETIVFLRSGDTLQITTNQPSATLVATARQIADVYGSLTQPTGYVAQ